MLQAQYKGLFEKSINDILNKLARFNTVCSFATENVNAGKVRIEQFETSNFLKKKSSLCVIKIVQSRETIGEVVRKSKPFNRTCYLTKIL